MIPDEWKDADFSDKQVRGAFADWLEEREDWRAEEIRRIWVDVWPKDKYPYPRENEVLHAIKSGPFLIDTFPRNDVGMPKVINEIIRDLWSEGIKRKP